MITKEVRVIRKTYKKTIEKTPSELSPLFQRNIEIEKQEQENRL